MADDDSLLSQYGNAIMDAHRSASDYGDLALKNMKSGHPGMMLLGAGQDVLAPAMHFMAPVTAGLDLARQGLTYRFGEPVGNAFDVASTVMGGPEDVANALRLAGKAAPVAAMAAIPRRSGSIEEAVARAEARSRGATPENKALQVAKSELSDSNAPIPANATVGHNNPPPDPLTAPPPPTPTPASSQGAFKLPPLTPSGDPELAMYEKAPGSDPRYLGAGEDRSTSSLLRYNPKQGTSARTQEALDALNTNKDGIKDQMLKDIANGQTLLGDSWYNTEELRDWFIQEHGPEKGDEYWKEFMNVVGATSTGSKVPSNLGTASYYFNKGGDWAKENYDALMSGDLLPEVGSGYGHKMQGNHAKNVARMYSDEWAPNVDPKLNPKPRGFIQSLIGNPTNIAADLHFTRYMAMASGSPEWLNTSSQISADLAGQLRAKYGEDIENYLTTKKGDDGKPIINFRAKSAVKDGVAQLDDIKDEPTVFAGKPNDNEYRAFERYMNELGKELGMTGAQVQANLWMGAAQRTGLADESQGTFMQLLRARAAKRAEKEGITQQEVLRRFVRDRGLLTPAPLAAGAAGAAAMYAGQDQQPTTYARGGSIVDRALNLTRRYGDTYES
jgi:hypothetical protein